MQEQDDSTSSRERELAYVMSELSKPLHECRADLRRLHPDSMPSLGHAAGDESPPSWAEMRELGGMVVDREHEKLAVYVGADGHVVLMSGLPGDGAEFTPVHHSDVPLLISALALVMPQAAEEDRKAQARWDAAERQYEAHAAGKTEA